MNKKLVGIMTVLAVIFITGCSKQKATSVEDFKKIEVGMSKKEVEKAIGKPTDINDDLDNQRVLKQLVPFQELILKSQESLPVPDTLVTQLSTTIEKVLADDNVTYYIYDYESKKTKDETSTQIVFCDNKVSLILIDEETDGIYDFETD